MSLPTPVITTPTVSPTYTTAFPILDLGGTFATGMGITSILVNGAAASSNISGGWSTTVNLLLGDNTFLVVASDGDPVDDSLPATLTVTCTTTTAVVQDYVNLITSEYNKQPNFIATVAANMQPSVQIQAVIVEMITSFCLTTPAVGNQLDILGQWAGINRYVTIGGVITALSDMFFYQIVLAKIQANYWDGTTEQLYAIWDLIFPTVNLLIQDNENMSYTIAIQGIVPDATTQALLTEGYFLPKPEGIRIANYLIPVNTGPLFAWNIENSIMSGWGTGSWPSIIPGS